jgi:hypothetical protein
MLKIIKIKRKKERDAQNKFTIKKMECEDTVKFWS